MKEKILTWVAILVLAAAGVLAYCHYRWPERVCLHKWQAATCEQAMQCEKCGKVEGVPIGHDWADTTCTAPSPCSMCGTLEGIELTHTWREDGRICTACGLDERPQEVRFMERLSMSLNERWDYMNGRPWYAVRDKFIWDEFTREELELLTEFQAVEFEDEELGELASRYVETILETEAALVDFGSETWERAYYDWIRHEQNVVLYEISRLYDIEVAEDYQPLLQELIDGGEEITIITQVTDAIRIHIGRCSTIFFNAEYFFDKFSIRKITNN